MKEIIISPSILSADFTHLSTDIAHAERGGAKWIHYDVMDGHFVNNISLGIPLVECVSKSHKLVNDVHIMISDPLRYAKRFCDAGADYITFHLEACKDANEVWAVCDLIHSCGKKVGLSIRPETNVEKVFPFIYSLDLVLIMSVVPGFGGQEFDQEAVTKIIKLRDYMNTNEISKTLISVDGGINAETGKLCVEAGADVLVAGSYIFKSDDIEGRIGSLKE